MKEYVNMKTGKRVPEELAQEYAMEKLGIPRIVPMGKFGVMTLDQYNFLDTFTEWYFSGEWILEEVQEDTGNIFELINEECELDDRCYV